jgi:hypothetical protein
MIAAEHDRRLNATSVTAASVRPRPFQEAFSDGGRQANSGR